MPPPLSYRFCLDNTDEGSSSEADIRMKMTCEDRCLLHGSLVLSLSLCPRVNLRVLK